MVSPTFALHGESVHMPGTTGQNALHGGSVQMPGGTVQSKRVSA
jgi:hypothetical protein